MATPQDPEGDIVDLVDLTPSGATPAFTSERLTAIGIIAALVVAISLLVWAFVLPKSPRMARAVNGLEQGMERQAHRAMAGVHGARPAVGIAYGEEGGHGDRYERL